MSIRHTFLVIITLAFVPCGSALGQAVEPTLSETAIDVARRIVEAGPALEDAGGLASPTQADDAPAIPPAPETILREPEPITPPPERRLNVMLDWYLNPYHAALIVAQERDLFAREGLEVTLTIPADPSAPPKLVAARRTELAITSQPRLHLLVDQGLPLIRVGTLVPLPLSTLLVREDSDIASLSDLDGKTIGYALEDQARVLLDGMLANQPLSPDKIALERVDFALARSLVEKEVDGVIGALRHVERRQMAQDGVTGREFAAEEHGMPLYDEMILIANRDALKQHRRDIVHFLEALQNATHWLIGHPDEAWTLVSQARPALDTEANARAWDDTLRYLALRPAVLQAQRYVSFEAYLRERGLIEEQAPLERLAVDLSAP